MNKEYQPGDEVIFFNTKYTLLEKTEKFGWLAIETNNENAKPRIILTEYLETEKGVTNEKNDYWV